MEYPREISNSITQFEDSFDNLNEFLKQYQWLGLDPASRTKLRLPRPRPSIDQNMPRPSNKSQETNRTGQVTTELQLKSRPSINEDMSSLDEAKKHLVDAYAVNSIFWMYLCVQGVNPRDHVKHELERIRKYMNLIKDAADKQKAPKLNVKASKRLIRGAMFDTSVTNKKVKKEN